LVPFVHGPILGNRGLEMSALAATDIVVMERDAGCLVV
jgi:hypothetical protein